MPLIDPTQPRAQMDIELPPSAAFPPALQTLACRLLPLAYFEHCRARYGSRFTVYPVDMPPLVFLSDPGDIRTVFTAPASVLHAGTGGAIVAPLFGEESFTLREEDEHLCGRQAILPAFTRRVAYEHSEIVSEIARREVASWPLDIEFATHSRLRALGLRVIMRSLFGEENAAFDELHRQLLQMLSVMAGLLLQAPRLRQLPGWSTKWKRFLRQRDEVDRSIFALIAQWPRGGQSSDLLDMLLTTRNLDSSRMSDRQVRDNLVSVLIAGHETTAAELAWAFQLLAHNQAVQGRLIDEIDRGDGDEYMTATVQETLRHRPAFLFAGPRAVVQPIAIGGWTYHPPTQLLGCTYLVHHDPAIYPDPYEFRPERFLDSPPNARTWLPWGGGRKHCLGQHLALLEIRTVLHTVLAARRVLPARDRIERARWRSVIVTPHAGSRVILRERRRRGRPPQSRPGNVSARHVGACSNGNVSVPIGTDSWRSGRTAVIIDRDGEFEHHDPLRESRRGSITPEGQPPR